MALALAAVALIPAIFAAVIRGLARVGERIPGSMLVVAVTELRSTATRSIALAGVAALAVYGSVAIGGARQDLLHGLDNAFGQYLDTADIWVTTGGNDLTTNDFRGGGAAGSDPAERPGSPRCATTRARFWTSAPAACGSSPDRQTTPR